MENNSARFAQELGEIEVREQEAIRGMEMFATEYKENGRWMENAENTTAGLEKARKEIVIKIADTDTKIFSLENERESDNAWEERKMDIELAREAYNTSWLKLEELLGLLQFKAACIKLIIKSSFSNKLIMGSFLDNLSVVKHYDNICILYSGKAMCNYKYRSILMLRNC